MNKEGIPKVNFSKKYKGDTSKRTVDIIKNILKKGRYVRFQDIDPRIDKPKDWREKHAFYYRNKAIIFYQNESSIRVTVFKNNENKGSNNKKEKEITLNYHADKRRMGRVISDKEIFSAIHNGIWIPDYKSSKGKVKFDSKYFIDDLCVVVNEGADYLNVQTIYRLGRVSDHSFIEYLTENESDLKNMYFGVVNQSKINRIIQSPLFIKNLFLYNMSKDEAIGESLVDSFLSSAKDAVVFFSNKKSQFNSKWDYSILKPKKKYSMVFLFDSDSEEDGNITKEEEEYFEDLGFSFDKNVLHGKLPGLTKTFCLFDLTDYSGPSYTFARPSGKGSLIKKRLQIHDV